MRRSIILAVVLFFGASGLARGQLTWTKIPTPAPVTQFALGSDGSIYILTGSFQSASLFFTSNEGAQWTQIYSGPSIRGLSCDSNGAVIILDGPLFISTNHGSNWDTSGSINAVDENGSSIASTAAATYFAYGAESSLKRTTDYGKNWDSLGSFTGGRAAYNWADLYAGPGDRLICTLADGGLVLFSNALQSTDIPARTTCIADNSPLEYVISGRDGFIYGYQLCTLLRLPANSLKWQRYGDSLFRLDVDTTSRLPIASPNALTILSLDSFATYASYDHGDSWQIIGAGLPVPSPANVIATFGSDGNGYAVADGILYQTSFFNSSVSSRLSQPPIALYPIPCSSSLTIDAADIERVEILDLLGVTRFEQVFQETSNPQLDVSNLSPGIYSIIVVTAGQREIVRMVKE